MPLRLARIAVRQPALGESLTNRGFAPGVDRRQIALGAPAGADFATFRLLSRTVTSAGLLGSRRPARRAAASGLAAGAVAQKLLIPLQRN
jgi:hypothetical protein